MKKLCGVKLPNGSNHDSLILLKNIEKSSGGTTKDLANKINETFLTPMNDFAPLSRDFTNNFVNNTREDHPKGLLSVSTEKVRTKKLENLK